MRFYGFYSVLNSQKKLVVVHVHTQEFNYTQTLHEPLSCFNSKYCVGSFLIHELKMGQKQLSNKTKHFKGQQNSIIA
jgi:hypothetical protein